MNPLWNLMLLAGFAGFGLGCFFMGAVTMAILRWRRPYQPPKLPAQWSPGMVDRLKQMTVFGKPGPLP